MRTCMCARAYACVCVRMRACVRACFCMRCILRQHMHVDGELALSVTSANCTRQPRSPQIYETKTQMTMQRFTLGMFVLLAVMVSIGVGTSHATRHTMTAGLHRPLSPVSGPSLVPLLRPPFSVFLSLSLSPVLACLRCQAHIHDLPSTCPLRS